MLNRKLRRVDSFIFVEKIESFDSASDGEQERTTLNADVVDVALNQMITWMGTVYLCTTYKGMPGVCVRANLKGFHLWSLIH